MSIATQFEQIYNRSKQNRWMRYFTTFNRLVLAAGFIPSGYVKITGERFTDLPVNNPMGHYLQALFETGYYYTFIGIAQIVAAVLLLIPRTALLGALLYFPIILNICILSLSVRFEGSLLTAPLMVLANLYLFVWHYDKLKYIVYTAKIPMDLTPHKTIAYGFPFRFFAGVLATIVFYVLIITHTFDIMPRNTLPDCESQIDDSLNPQATADFCECIHTKGLPIGKCMDDYNKKFSLTLSKK